MSAAAATVGLATAAALPASTDLHLQRHCRAGVGIVGPVA
jgi:hypothetical protein